MASNISQEWKASKIRTAPFKHAKNGKWFFQFDYITKSWAKEGRSITKSNNSKTFSSIGYETLEECEKGK